MSLIFQVLLKILQYRKNFSVVYFNADIDLVRQKTSSNKMFQYQLVQRELLPMSLHRPDKIRDNVLSEATDAKQFEFGIF
jgi:hypothetical protein